MEVCQPPPEPAPSSRPFLVAAYLPDDSGTWCPSVLPTDCPTSDGVAACRIGLDYCRPRKTGPCVPVTVLECTTHGCRFTLYPCGHIPYGREAVAPVGLDGASLAAVATDTSPPEEERCAPWRQTRYAAVLDAAVGKAWPRDGPGPCWTTQLQRLAELAALLGLEPAPSAPVGEKLAHLAGVPRLGLLDATHSFADAKGFEARGGILLGTLHSASMGRRILERVLACGALAGLWNAVHLWRATPGRPQRTVFPGRGTPSG